MEGKGKTIGRVAVDRAIRLQPEAPRRGASTGVARAAPDDFTCAHCGTVICAAGRARLFHGMVLTCTRCGTPNKCGAQEQPRAATGSS